MVETDEENGSHTSEVVPPNAKSKQTQKRRLLFMVLPILGILASLPFVASKKGELEHPEIPVLLLIFLGYLFFVGLGAILDSGNAKDGIAERLADTVATAICVGLLVAMSYEYVVKEYVDDKVEPTESFFRNHDLTKVTALSINYCLRQYVTETKNSRLKKTVETLGRASEIKWNKLMGEKEPKPALENLSEEALLDFVIDPLTPALEATDWLWFLNQVPEFSKLDQNQKKEVAEHLREHFGRAFREGIKRDPRGQVALNLLTDGEYLRFQSQLEDGQRELILGQGKLTSVMFILHGRAKPDQNKVIPNGAQIETRYLPGGLIHSDDLDPFLRRVTRLGRKWLEEGDAGFARALSGKPEQRIEQIRETLAVRGDRLQKNHPDRLEEWRELAFLELAFSKEENKIGRPRELLTRILEGDSQNSWARYIRSRYVEDESDPAAATEELRSLVDDEKVPSYLRLSIANDLYLDVPRAEKVAILETRWSLANQLRPEDPSSFSPTVEIDWWTSVPDEEARHERLLTLLSKGHLLAAGIQEAQRRPQLLDLIPWSAIIRSSELREGPHDTLYSWLELGSVYLSQNRNSEALACFQEAKRFASNPIQQRTDVHLLVGRALRDCGQPTEAVEFFQGSIAEHRQQTGLIRESTPALNDLLNIHLQSGDLNNFFEVLREAKSFYAESGSWEEVQWLIQEEIRINIQYKYWDKAALALGQEERILENHLPHSDDSLHRARLIQLKRETGKIQEATELCRMTLLESTRRFGDEVLVECEEIIKANPDRDLKALLETRTRESGQWTLAHEIRRELEGMKTGQVLSGLCKRYSSLAKKRRVTGEAARECRVLLRSAFGKLVEEKDITGLMLALPGFLRIDDWTSGFAGKPALDVFLPQCAKELPRGELEQLVTSIANAILDSGNDVRFFLSVTEDLHEDESWSGYCQRLLLWLRSDLRLDDLARSRIAETYAFFLRDRSLYLASVDAWKYALTIDAGIRPGRIHYELGMTHELAGQLGEAHLAFVRSAQRATKDVVWNGVAARSWIAAAEISLTLEDYDAAAAESLQASVIARDPITRGIAHEIRALAFLAENQLERASGAIDRACQYYMEGGLGFLQASLRAELQTRRDAEKLRPERRLLR